MYGLNTVQFLIQMHVGRRQWTHSLAMSMVLAQALYWWNHWFWNIPTDTTAMLKLVLNRAIMINYVLFFENRFITWYYIYIYVCIYIYTYYRDRYSHMFGVFDPYSCCQVMGGLSCHCSVSLFIKNVLELYCWGGSTTRCQYLRHSLRVRVLNIAQELAAGSPAVAKHVGQTPQQQAPHVSVNCMASSLATEV